MIYDENSVLLLLCLVCVFKISPLNILQSNSTAYSVGRSHSKFAYAFCKNNDLNLAEGTRFIARAQTHAHKQYTRLNNGFVESIVGVDVLAFMR